MMSSAPNPAAENAALRAALAEERAALAEERAVPDTGGSRDRTSEAADREVASRAVRPVLGTGAATFWISWNCNWRRWRQRRARMRARAKPTTAIPRVRAFTRRKPKRAPLPADLPRERVVAALARGLPLLWWRRYGQAGGRRHGDAGGGAQAVEGGADGAGEVQLPGLRGHHAAAGAAPCDPARARRPGPAGDDRLRQVRHAPAAHPAEPGLRGRGHRARRLDAG